ncbi:MAG: DUF1365 domain-containing protein [Verrucomicrobia bacterium]|nr:DUF1365 domain-containing protein [Verrucomicrobiota bacterium]
MNSAIYECRVMHHRLSPKEHQFRYEIFLLALDLDELDLLAKHLPFFSHNRRNIYEFRDRDHLTLPGHESASLKENLLAYLHEHHLTFPPDGKIQLITLPRVFGYIFNPVSFYFCTTSAGLPLYAVVQVGNTFGEIKPYLIPAPTTDRSFRQITPKHFYVSPFSPLDLDFDFHLRLPNEKLEIHINDLADGRPILVTSLLGNRLPLTNARLAWFTLKYPFITLKVITLIHWHAFRLWTKRLPWYPKADRPDLQRQVLHPHASLREKSS